MRKLLEIFCKVDDFVVEFMAQWEKKQLGDGAARPRCGLTASEIMTIMIYFHQMRFRDFKTYYIHYVQAHLKAEFPGLVSYNRFVELMASVMMPLCCFVNSQPKASTGIYFVDSTVLPVCHIRRASSHKVFKGTARKTMSSVGWAYGLKLHSIINHQGQLMAYKLTSANVNDRKTVESMAENLQGKLIGDKGYIGQKLFNSLYQKGLHLLTKIKKNMKNKLIPLADKLLLSKRFLIETVFGQLKNMFQIQHTRHRSPVNFLVNLFAALAAYSLKPLKPSISSVPQLLHS